jgi:quaternary ammonium compound-resistance protein SugE
VTLGVHWFALVVAGLIEIVFAVALSRTDGFTKPLWVVAFLVAATTSLLLLEYAMRAIPVGTAYAVWTGVGAVGTAIVGMAMLGEPSDTARVLCILLIVIAVIGLQVTGAGHP